MRILKIGFVVKRKEAFRIGAYVGEVLFKYGSYVLVRDLNDGARQMNFHFYTDLT